jgi:hypothetical protein
MYEPYSFSGEVNERSRNAGVAADVIAASAAVVVDLFRSCESDWDRRRFLLARLADVSTGIFSTISQKSFSRKTIDDGGGTRLLKAAALMLAAAVAKDVEVADDRLQPSPERRGNPRRAWVAFSEASLVLTSIQLLPLSDLLRKRPPLLLSLLPRL